MIRRLSTIHLFALLPWIGIVVAARQPIRDNSFLWHIRAGDVQARGGEVLRTDPFSFTAAGEAWRTQSWLADLLYAALHDEVGLDFVPWLIVVCSVVMAICVGVASARSSRSIVATAIAMAAIAWVGVSFLSPRPVLFSYAFLALLVLIVDRPAMRWGIPALIWIWAAVHGSFVIGIGYVVLHGLARKRRFVPDVVATVVAASLTAHGLGVWQTLGRFMTNRDALDLITEWAPPRLTSPDLLPYAALIGVLLWGAASGAISRRDLFVVVPFVLFGLSASRSLFPAVIVLTPYAARAIGTRLDRDRPGPHPAALAAAAGIILALPFLITPDWEGLSDERFPVEAARYLDEGPVFHDDIVGGYLIYAHPEIPVYVDDRAELFGADHFRELIATRSARPGWEETLDGWGIDQALLASSDGLVSVLTLAGWEQRYADDRYVLLTR